MAEPGGMRHWELLSSQCLRAALLLNFSRRAEFGFAAAGTFDPQAEGCRRGWRRKGFAVH